MANSILLILNFIFYSVRSFTDIRYYSADVRYYSTDVRYYTVRVWCLRALMLHNEHLNHLLSHLTETLCVCHRAVSSGYTSLLHHGLSETRDPRETPPPPPSVNVRHLHWIRRRRGVGGARKLIYLHGAAWRGAWWHTGICVCVCVCSTVWRLKRGIGFYHHGDSGIGCCWTGCGESATTESEKRTPRQVSGTDWCVSGMSSQVNVRERVP